MASTVEDQLVLRLPEKLAGRVRAMLQPLAVHVAKYGRVVPPGDQLVRPVGARSFLDTGVGGGGSPGGGSGS